MTRRFWTTHLILLAVVVLGSEPSSAKPGPHPVKPTLSPALQDGVRTYLTTHAWQLQRAEDLRDELAPRLERAGLRPEQWSEAVRQVFPLHMPDLSRRTRWGYLNRRNTRHGSYPVYLPDGYTPERAWPLHITLHGGGGHDGFRCRDYWPRYREHQSFILLCPSTPEGRFQNWSGEGAFWAALHDTLRSFNVDPERISIGGLSTGASASWVLTAKHPGRWRALVSRAGGPLLAPLYERAPAYSNLHATPTLVLHGALDDLIRVSTARGGVEMLKKANIFHTYWEDPKAGHVTFSHRNPDIVAWIASRRRPPLPKRFRHVSGRIGISSPMVHWLYSAQSPGEVQASVEAGGRVTIEHSEPTSRMVVFLPEPFLDDPGAPVEIVVGGAIAFSGVVEPSVAAAMASYWKTFDHTRTFTRAVVLDWTPTTPGEGGVWQGRAMR